MSYRICNIKQAEKQKAHHTPNDAYSSDRTLELLLKHLRDVNRVETLKYFVRLIITLFFFQLMLHSPDEPSNQLLRDFLYFLPKV